MFPKLFILPTYGLLFALGTVVAWWWFIRRARTLDLPEEQLFNLSFYALLGGILGAKLTLILVDWRTYVEHPAALWGTLRSAGVLIGGVFVGAVVFTVYARRHGMPLFRLGDAIAAPLALAQSIGRLGCFAAGCCWGVRADEHSLWSVEFTNPVAHDQTGVPLNLALVPTQLYQMAADLALALLLTWLWRKRLEPAGSVFWIYVVVYSITRGTIELWRGDVDRGLYFGDILPHAVSTSQLFAIAGLAFGLVMLIRGRWKAAAS